MKVRTMDSEVLSFSWILLFVNFGAIYGIPLTDLSDARPKTMHLDYATDLDQFIPDDYGGWHFKGEDALLNYLLSKGCTYLAGYFSSF